MRLPGVIAAVGGAAGLAALVYYLFRDEDRPPKKKASAEAKQPAKSSVVQLDEDDLDPEERKALAEVKKKGYYHGRPKSETAHTPGRSADAAPAAVGPADAADASRLKHDDFQKKWDRFGSDSFIKSLERDD
eukprot:TRINITY_DN40562_c0_g2_i3.p1 TRINITY_DN40562_c0_g2~~TRINITY_DN40562_c0_g2_i3.p1  ORF type:complete len:132 (+),score=44.45 TRINITY_DN40562_c0_g2_i3:122-517(+)